MSCPDYRGLPSSRKRQQLRALWLLTCFISEVVSFDLGIMLQTPCNPLGKHGPASVRASPLNPSRIQKRWAKVLRTAEGVAAFGVWEYLLLHCLFVLVQVLGEGVSTVLENTQGW